MLDDHCLKTWSSTQSSPALSSCEAEYYAVVDGASRGLGMQTAAKELGVDVADMTVSMATDSSGAKSFASWRGSGRIRHIEVKWLWLQQAVAEGRFRMLKVPGKKNPADIVTKFKSLKDYQEQLEKVNVFVEARAVGNRVVEGITALGGLAGGVGVFEQPVAASTIVARGASTTVSMSEPGCWGGGARLNWADASEEECKTACYRTRSDDC